MFRRILFSSLLVLVSESVCAAQCGATLPYKFTLAALNTNQPNSNSTGAPLVLGQDGASSGVTFHVTSTYASFPYNDYPSLGLVNGNLRAFGSDGWWATNATDVQNGATLEWITSTISTAEGAQVYSAVDSPDSTDPNCVLALHGISDQWSLCPFTSTGQVNVVFSASASSQQYDVNQCYPVRLNLAPTS